MNAKILMGYLSYILRHKWFVFVECLRLGIPWRGLVHDLSKLTPSEFGPYMRYFTAPQARGREWPTEAEADEMSRQAMRAAQCNYYPKWTQERVKRDLNAAWNLHQKRNRHHWQYWVLLNDTDEPLEVLLPMPDRYRREMLADWRGASRALGYGRQVREWYLKHSHKMRLHSDTRAWLEHELGVDA